MEKIQAQVNKFRDQGYEEEWIDLYIIKHYPKGTLKKFKESKNKIEFRGETIYYSNVDEFCAITKIPKIQAMKVLKINFGKYHIYVDGKLTITDKL